MSCLFLDPVDVLQEKCFKNAWSQFYRLTLFKPVTSEAHCPAQWHPEAHCPVRWHPEAHCPAQWHPEAHCPAQWQPEAHCSIRWHLPSRRLRALSPQSDGSC